MRFFLAAALMLLVLNAFVDFLIYRILRSSKSKPIYCSLQLWSAIVLAVVAIVLTCMPKSSGSDGLFMVTMWTFYAYLTVYVPKYVFLIFSGFAYIPKLFHKKPLRWLVCTGAILGVVVFALMWWGVYNRTRLQVKEVTVYVESLPPTFDGFRIAQISDIHSGSYGHDTSFLEKLVNKTNSLKPDLIVFTGDIVNRKSEELKPFVHTLSGFKAPCGVYSIMGNHDYGDYSVWPSEKAKDEDVLNLKNLQKKMGWHMLNNEHDVIRIGSDSIILIGVENIADAPFKSYGDLAKAYPDLSDDNTKILLSHNPWHWHSEVCDRNGRNVALTLSGHTHAMQIELLGLSPAVFRYPEWGGLYTDSNNRNLYVNIGAGTVGMPFRIGATPEITIITLKTK